MTQSDYALAQAVLSRVFGLGITPRATLTQQANPGDSQLHVSATVDGSGNPLFVKYQNLSFWDGAAQGATHFAWNDTEEPFAIAAVDYTHSVLTLDFSGTGVTGLQHTHLSGASVGGNLFDELPNDEAPALSTTYPYVWAAVKGEKSERMNFSDVRRVWTLIVTYEALAQRPSAKGDTAAMNTNLFSRRQWRKARINTEAIAAALLADSTLLINGVSYALGFAQNAVSKDWGRPVINKETARIEATMPFIVHSGLVPVE